MTRVSILLNQHRPGAWTLARRALDWLRPRNITIQLPKLIAQAMSEEELGVEDEQLSQTDLIITLGGDGTILSAARIAVPNETPILGVNLGRLGFIATVQPDEFEEGLTRFFDGEHSIEKRMMIECTINRAGKPVSKDFALNEIVVHRPIDKPMLNFGIFIDNHRVTSYPADGIIVSSPTGSTAYNLSAGGPVVEPTMQAMILNALSPHTLGARPFVTRAEAVITLNVESAGHALLVADGHSMLHLEPNEVLTIAKASFSTTLVTFRQDDFYTKLGKRLLYGARVEE